MDFESRAREHARIQQEQRGAAEAAALKYRKHQDEMVQQFVASAGRANIPTKEFVVVQEHNSGIMKLVFSNARYGVSGTVRGWALLNDDGEHQKHYAVITTEGRIYRLQSGMTSLPRSLRKQPVIVQPDPNGPFRGESPELRQVSSTLESSMLSLIADRL